MNKMLNLLYAGRLDDAMYNMPWTILCKYEGPWQCVGAMGDDDFITMLLLIAVAEGYEL